MIDLVASIVAVAAAVMALACWRVSSWHASEAAFWRHIQALSMAASNEVLQDMAALLRWSQEHPVSFWRRVRGWESPHVRRAQCLR